jgi:hypothetical protein
VTRGFVTLNLNKVERAAQDMEQENADGEICVADRSAPQRKWYTPALELCNVNTELITLFNGWEQYLDYNDVPIGFRDQPEVEDKYGVAIEVWTGGRADDDCPTPSLDTIFSNTGSGQKYGYWLFGGTEWSLGDVKIGAMVSTFTLTGKTIAMPHWGKGPYNVSAIDDTGKAGRLLVPVGQKEHLTVFRTPIEPPAETDGAAPLAISSLFTAPNFYFGGPAGAAPAAVAPEQVADGVVYTLKITGTPTGGTFTLKVDGSASGTIAYNATAAAVKTVLEDAGPASADWTVTGTALPTGPVSITVPDGVTLATDSATLTGGTAPAVSLVKV